jgi:hypothetical protein
MIEDGHNKAPRRTTLYAGSAACRVPGYRPASTAELGEAGPYLAYGFFHQREARGSPLSLLLSEISLPAEQAATYKGGCGHKANAGTNATIIILKRGLDKSLKPVEGHHGMRLDDAGSIQRAA